MQEKSWVFKDFFSPPFLSEGNCNDFSTFYINIRAGARSYTEILLLKTLCQLKNYSVFICSNHNGYHLRTYFAGGICAKNLHALLDTRTYIAAEDT